MAEGAKAGGRAGRGSEGGWAGTPPQPRGARETDLFPLSTGSPAPKHAGACPGVLGAAALWPGEPGRCVPVSSPCPPLSHSPPHRVPMVFLRAGAWAGRKRLPRTTRAAPSPALAGRGGGAGRGLSPTRRWRAGPRSRGAGGGGARGARPLGATQRGGRGSLGGGGGAAERAASRVRAAARMAGAAGGARARPPGLPSERPQLPLLPGGPSHRRR